jgi:hypothetical protein
MLRSQTSELTSTGAPATRICILPFLASLLPWITLPELLAQPTFGILPGLKQTLAEAASPPLCFSAGGSVPPESTAAASGSIAMQKRKVGPWSAKKEELEDWEGPGLKRIKKRLEGMKEEELPEVGEWGYLNQICCVK